MSDALPALLLGHFVGDWIVQTDWQAANKPTSWKANQQHMIGYHASLTIAAALVVSWPALAAILAVSWVTHSIIDRRWPVVWLLQHTGSRPFSQTTFGVVAVDQALHLSILCALTLALR